MKRKKAIALGSVAAIGLLLAGYFAYVEPKLMLFAPDRLVHNFSHMDGVFPSNPIGKSPRPHRFDISPQPIPASFTFDGRRIATEEFLARSQTTGLLVIKDGKIAHETYYSGYTPQTRSTSFSVAKSFVSTLIGIAIDEGRIDSVHDPLTKYVPELESSGFAKVRISDALQMSSGIDFSEEYENEKTDAYTIFDQLYLYMRPIDNVILDYGSKEQPGQAFYYASINTQALSQVLRQVYGQDLAAITQEKLWQPLGMESDAYWSTDLYGDELGFMSLNATLRDFAKFGMLFLGRGSFNGKRIVSESWVEQSTTADKPFLQRGEINGDWGYQYQWWLPRGSQTDFAAIGIWGQMIYVNPQARLVIVKTSADKNFHPHEFEAVQLFREIARSLD